MVSTTDKGGEIRRRGGTLDRARQNPWWIIRPWTAIPLVLALSLLDAAFTLFLLGRGAFELNPLMACLIERDPLLFLAVKLFLTGGSLLVILIYEEAPLFRTSLRVKALFSLLPIPFLLVIKWELYLIFFVL
jgi:hypothetical protein